MSEFYMDKRDMAFVLFDQLKVGEFESMAAFEGYDRDTLEMTIDGAVRFATEKLAPIYEQAEAEGVKVIDGEAILPAVFEDAYRHFCENGYLSVSRNPEYDGMGMPMAIAVACTEIFCAAAPSFMFTPGLTDSAAHLIEAYGSQEQKDLCVSRMYRGVWGGTMCLTEPQAGSSVGDLLTKATPVDGEDYFKVSGNKIFISSGDQQLTENIMHLVLARIPGDPPGTRGISLFLVPKYRVDADGKRLGSNDVTLSGIEHKMGLHASATCALSFGDNDECHGYLIGERCKGIVYMFQMMNEARLVTGVQGSAIGNAAYQLALNYARERKQGPKLTDRTDTPESVAILEHPDVRRNMMTMKAYGESIRALCLNLAAKSDIAEHSADAEEREHAHALVDLLTPIAKAFSSDMGFRITEIAVQVFGGYGYISEYGVERALRDVKIASLYEGTNGIQALDLLGRKMRAKGGGLFLTWLQDINGQLDGLKEHGELGGIANKLDSAKNALCKAAFAFPQAGRTDPEYPMLHATPYLRMFGLVECSRLLLEQADISHNHLTKIWADKGIDSSDKDARLELAKMQDDVRFYEGKINTAKFFAFQLLPEVHALLDSVESEDRSALEMLF